MTIGVRCFHEGRFREAISAFSQMRDTARKAGLPKEEGEALRLLGNALDKQGAPSSEVDEVYKQALKAAHEQDNMELSFNVLLGMASHQLKLNDADLAEHFYLQALTLAKRVLGPREEATAESNIAMCLARSEQRRAESFPHFRRAMDLHAGGHTNDPHGNVRLRVNYASALSAQGQHEQAEAEYERSLAEAKKIGDSNVAANVLMNLANLCDFELAAPAKAREHRAALSALCGGTMGTDTCPICLEALEAEGALEPGGVVTLPCRHALHGQCWEGWRNGGMGSPDGGNVQCPLCRDPLGFAAR